MIKRFFYLIVVATTFSFAQDETDISNICDTLSNSSNVELRLAYVDETLWHGDKNLSVADSVKHVRHQGYATLEPIYTKFRHVIPYSISAGCNESSNNLYAYAEWDNKQGKWSLNGENNDYFTVIWNVTQNTIVGYDATNSYNILVFEEGDELDLENLTSENLMVSRTFELNFDSWYAIAQYTTTRETNGSTLVRPHAMFVTRLDSATAIRDAVKALDVPDSISKVDVQIFHSVLSDSRKIAVESSSSEEQSSGSEAESSSSEGQGSGGEESSSSTEIDSSDSEGSSSGSTEVTSSSKQERSSSSKGSTAIGRLGDTPRMLNGSREVRRLNGSIVKAGEPLKPGVYYVKGFDGLWRKQVELPR
jgi:hypothetical protein